MKPKVEHTLPGDGQRKTPMSSRYRQRDCLTTEELAEAAIETVQQMSPAEKAELRRQLEQDLRFSKTALLAMPVSGKVN
jgi:hypothetical protein